MIAGMIICIRQISLRLLRNKGNTMLSEKTGSKISIRENPKLEKLRSAPEEVMAKAIRELLRKDT